MKTIQPKLLVILLLFVQSIYAQNHWESIPFPDTAANITCIAFNDGDEIYVGTSERNTLSGLYKSAPPYEYWQLIFDSNVHGLSAVEVYSNFVFLGKKGFNTFQISTDYGLTWVSKDLPSSTDLGVKEIYYHPDGALYIGTGSSPYSYPLLIRSYDMGDTWESLCLVDSASSSSVQDIMVTDEGDIYFCVDGYFEGLGGVYRSVDDGITWDFIGLQNHMVTSLDMNNEGDIIAGSWGGADINAMGIFLLEKNEIEWQRILYGQIQSCLFNVDDHIYSTYQAIGFEDGVVRSIDGGITFEGFHEGLNGAVPHIIQEDRDSYLWVAAFNQIYKTNESTAVSINDYPYSGSNSNGRLEIFPNPSDDYVTISGFPLQKSFIIQTLQGKVVLQGNFASNKPINISGISSGIYLIIVPEVNRNALLFIN